MWNFVQKLSVLLAVSVVGTAAAYFWAGAGPMALWLQAVMDWIYGLADPVRIARWGLYIAGAVLDWFGSFLPQTMHDALDGFSNFLQGDLCAEILKCSYWFTDQFTFAVTIWLAVFSVFLLMPLYVCLRGAVWGFHQLWGSD